MEGIGECQLSLSCAPKGRIHRLLIKGRVGFVGARFREELKERAGLGAEVLVHVVEERVEGLVRPVGVGDVQRGGEALVLDVVDFPEEFEEPARAGALRALVKGGQSLIPELHRVPERTHTLCLRCTVCRSGK